MFNLHDTYMYSYRAFNSIFSTLLLWNKFQPYGSFYDNFIHVQLMKVQVNKY